MCLFPVCFRQHQESGRNLPDAAPLINPVLGFREYQQVVAGLQGLDTHPDRIPQLHGRSAVYGNGLNLVHDGHAQPADKPGQQFPHENRQVRQFAEGVFINILGDLRLIVHHPGNGPRPDRYRDKQVAHDRAVDLAVVAQENHRVAVVQDNMVGIHRPVAVEFAEHRDQEARQVRLPVRFRNHMLQLPLQCRVFRPGLPDVQELLQFFNIQGAQRKPDRADQCADYHQDQRDHHHRLEPGGQLLRALRKIFACDKAENNQGRQGQCIPQQPGQLPVRISHPPVSGLNLLPGYAHRIRHNLLDTPEACQAQRSADGADRQVNIDPDVFQLPAAQHHAAQHDAAEPQHQPGDQQPGRILPPAFLQMPEQPSSGGGRNESAENRHHDGREQPFPVGRQQRVKHGDRQLHCHHQQQADPFHRMVCLDRLDGRCRFSAFLLRQRRSMPLIPCMQCVPDGHQRKSGCQGPSAVPSDIMHQDPGHGRNDNCLDDRCSRQRPDRPSGCALCQARKPDCHAVRAQAQRNGRIHHPDVAVLQRRGIDAGQQSAGQDQYAHEQDSPYPGIPRQVSPVSFAENGSIHNHRVAAEIQRPAKKRHVYQHVGKQHAVDIPRQCSHDGDHGHSVFRLACHVRFCPSLKSFRRSRT